MRFAAISSRWRQKLPCIHAIAAPHAVFSRCQTGPPASDTSEAELVQNPAASTESMFGLGPRKGVRADDPGREDFSAAARQMDAPESLEPPNDAEQNFFSKTWASQKTRPWPRFPEQQRPLREDYPIFQPKPSPLVNSSLNYAPRATDHDRIWQYASEMPSFTQERFVIASYNMLASAYIRLYRRLLYGHVPAQLLDWERRKRKIMLELELCSADILCLQEVDRFKELQDGLALQGYVGLFKVRTGRALDGCAIFWKKERFKLLQEESLEFSGLGMRDNVAQFCVLESTVPGTLNNGSASESGTARQGQSQCLVVANIHVLFNPKRGDMKLGQCRTFLEHAHKLSSLWHGAPVVIGGCFNCTPSSAIYDFLAKSELEVSGLDRSYLSGQIAEVASSASIKHIDKKAGDATAMSASFITSRVGSEASQMNNSEANLADKVKQSLRARFAFKNKICSTEFASAATEILTGSYKDSGNGHMSSVQGKDSCATDIEALVQEDKDVGADFETVHELKNEECRDGSLSSRTIEILKSSFCSQVSCEQIAHSRDSEREHMEEDEVTQGVPMESDLASTSSSALGMPEKISKEVEENDNITVHKHEWDLDELKIATGNSENTIVRHNLKLRSVYPEIQGCVGCRDAKGEPVITTYHRDFRGTVDYIWRSDGLQSVRVLETVPMDRLIRTKGLPSQVWGSDHLAIACELAFSQNHIELGKNDVELGT